MRLEVVPAVPAHTLVTAALHGQADDPVLSSAALATRLHKALRQQTREADYWRHRAIEAEAQLAEARR